GTPAVWQSLGLHGEGVKIAIIDSGIDYTHANFGGPGTADAYTAAHARADDGTPADPASLRPSAPRVKACIDLVGDSYHPDPSAVASTNAAKAGVIVVASAGNAGPSPYVIGSPSTADGTISVAANDPYLSFPGATIAVAGLTVQAINANGFALPGSSSFNIKVITGRGSLGCSVAAFGGPLPPDTIAVVNRGTCARVAKAIFGQQAGAAAVVMVNNAPGFPPFE